MKDDELIAKMRVAASLDLGNGNKYPALDDACLRSLANMAKQHFVEQACGVGDGIIINPDRFPDVAPWELRVADEAILVYQQSILERFK